MYKLVDDVCVTVTKTFQEKKNVYSVFSRIRKYITNKVT